MELFPYGNGTTESNYSTAMKNFALLKKELEHEFIEKKIQQTQK
jgi:hypothetical protein